MIKVALNGGLGNQLFQYAAGKALAVKNNTELNLDVIPLYSKLQWGKIATYRKYELDIFNINARRNDFSLKHKYLYPFAKTFYLLNRQLNKVRYHYFREKDFTFDGTVLSQPDNTYLEGHFQSEKYFSSIAPLIRKELTFSVPLAGKNNEWKERIRHCESVSVHIRRGDYLSLQKNLDKHGITSPVYYQEAVNHIASKLQQPVFFIFTDDVDWVKEHFTTHFPFSIIDNNQTPDSGHFDMQLMALCRHNIICNSTFSWWAAWLNANRDKMVIAPEKWFEDSSINSKDIYPSEWIKL